MNSMENFFNYMTKTIPKDEVIIWFNIHNMYYEKIDLYGDIFKSLNYIILNTHMGNEYRETKIILTNEDNYNHFVWCWNKMIEDFRKENIIIDEEGDHKDYFISFFNDTFYDQPDKKTRESINEFLSEIFNVDKTFVKPDLDILTEFYKILQKYVN
jgi:hypothetical protein